MNTNVQEFRVEVACDTLRLTLLPCAGPREVVTRHQKRNSDLSRILVFVNSKRPSL